MDLSVRTLARDAASYKRPLLSDTVSVADCISAFAICLQSVARLVSYRQRPRYASERAVSRATACLSVCRALGPCAGVPYQSDASYITTSSLSSP